MISVQFEGGRVVVVGRSQIRTVEVVVEPYPDESAVAFACRLELAHQVATYDVQQDGDR